jgi:hypothetical protein
VTGVPLLLELAAFGVLAVLCTQGVVLVHELGHAIPRLVWSDATVTVVVGRPQATIKVGRLILHLGALETRGVTHLGLATVPAPLPTLRQEAASTLAGPVAGAVAGIALVPAVHAAPLDPILHWSLLLMLAGSGIHSATQLISGHEDSDGSHLAALKRAIAADLPWPPVACHREHVDALLRAAEADRIRLGSPSPVATQGLEKAIEHLARWASVPVMRSEPVERERWEDPLIAGPVHAAPGRALTLVESASSLGGDDLAQLVQRTLRQHPPPAVDDPAAAEAIRGTYDALGRAAVLVAAAVDERRVAVRASAPPLQSRSASA